MTVAGPVTAGTSGTAAPAVRPAPDHPVLDFLLGVLVIMVIVALVVH